MKTIKIILYFLFMFIAGCISDEMVSYSIPPRFFNDIQEIERSQIDSQIRDLKSEVEVLENEVEMIKIYGPEYPYPSQRVGYEIEKLGRTLSNIGENFGDLAIRIESQKFRNQFFWSLNQYSLGFNKWYLENILKDRDYESWEIRFLKWHDAEVEKILNSMTQKRAQKTSKLQFDKWRTYKVSKIKSMAFSFIKTREITKLNIWIEDIKKDWAEAKKDNDKQLIEAVVAFKLKRLDDADLLEPGELETRLYNFKKNAQKLAFETAVRLLSNIAWDKVYKNKDFNLALKTVIDKKIMPEIEEFEPEPGDAANARYDLFKEILDEYNYIKTLKEITESKK